MLKENSGDLLFVESNSENGLRWEEEGMGRMEKITGIKKETEWSVKFGRVKLPFTVQVNWSWD